MNEEVKPTSHNDGVMYTMPMGAIPTPITSECISANKIKSIGIITHDGKLIMSRNNKKFVIIRCPFNDGVRDCNDNCARFNIIHTDQGVVVELCGTKHLIDIFVDCRTEVTVEQINLEINQALFIKHGRTSSNTDTTFGLRYICKCNSCHSEIFEDTLDLSQPCDQILCPKCGNKFFKESFNL